MNRIRHDEAEAPGVFVEPLAAACAAKAVAENALSRACTLVGPVAGEQVDRRPELMLAVSGKRALGSRLAEAVAGLVGPAREHPALRGEAPVRRLDAPLDSLASHLVEHPAKRRRGVAAKAF